MNALIVLKKQQGSIRQIILTQITPQPALDHPSNDIVSSNIMKSMARIGFC